MTVHIKIKCQADVLGIKLAYIPCTPDFLTLIYYEKLCAHNKYSLNKYFVSFGVTLSNIQSLRFMPMFLWIFVKCAGSGASGDCF